MSLELDHVMSILTGSSKRAAATADKSHVIDARPEGSSPCADLGTVEVSALELQQLRRIRREHERFVNKLHEMIIADRLDDVASAVEDEFMAIHGPRA